MAWTSPRTWVVSEFVTAALLNTHVRDNLLFLKSNPVIAEVTSTSVFSTENTPLTVLTTGSVAIPADVGAVYCEVWANAFGYQNPGGTYWYQGRIQESGTVLRVAGVNGDSDQRFTTANTDVRVPLYMRTADLAWAGTSRTVVFNIDSSGCVARVSATPTSPITLRIVRAY